MATISCADCGDSRAGCPSNTKYCKKCRQLRDLDHWQILTRICASTGCSKSFAPLNRNDLHCSTCNTGLRAYSGACALAFDANPHEGRYPNPVLPVCSSCARDPKLRRRLIGALELGQARRRKTNAPPPIKED